MYVCRSSILRYYLGNDMSRKYIIIDTFIKNSKVMKMGKLSFITHKPNNTAPYMLHARSPLAEIHTQKRTL